MDGVRWWRRFDAFGRLELVARGSRYAPIPSVSLGEFNRIAVRIMSDRNLSFPKIISARSDDAIRTRLV